MGRPKISDESTRKIPITITLTQDHIDKLKKIGRGNASEALRKIIDEYKKD